MKHKLLLDKNKRLLFKKNELKRLSIKIGNRLNTRFKINTFLKLFDTSIKSTFSRIKNRCFISGRSKGVYKKLKISRIKYRELITNGNLVGFTKNSW